MSNSDLFVAGSIHQGHERFSDISRGRQCSFMSFSALLCAQSYPVRQWNTCTVDQILTEGDSMYLNAFERQSIPDTETISLTYLPDRGRWSSPILAITQSQSSVGVEANKSWTGIPYEHWVMNHALWTMHYEPYLMNIELWTMHCEPYVMNIELWTILSLLHFKM